MKITMHKMAYTTLAVVVLSLTVAGNVFAGSVFPDLADSHFSAPFFELLKEKGVFLGDEKTGNIRPDVTLNRAEAVTLILRATGENAIITPIQSSFVDVSSSDWFYNSVELGRALDIITGYKNAQGELTGEFRPGDSVTRAEFSAMVDRAFQLENERSFEAPFVDIRGHWARDVIEDLWVNSVIDGTSRLTFRPNENITRGAAAKIIANAMAPKLRAELEAELENDEDQDDDEQEVPENEGDVEEEDKNEPEEEEEIEEENNEEEAQEENNEEESQEENNVEEEISESEILALPTSVERLVAPGKMYLAGTYNISAEVEPFLIRKVTVRAVGSPYDGYLNSAVMYYPKNFDQPELLNGKKIGRIETDGSIRFDGIDMAVERKGDAQFLVYFEVNSIDNAQETGRFFEPLFVANIQEDFEATGVHSQNDIFGVATDNSQIRKIFVRKAYPIFEEILDFTNLVLSPESPVYRVKVVAQENDISIARLSFQVGSGGVDLGPEGLGGTWKLVRTDRDETESISESTLIGGKVIFDLDNPEEIFGGEDAIFEVRAPVRSDGSNNNRTLSIRLIQDTQENADTINGDTTGTLAEIRASNNNSVIWSDQADPGHSETTEDWTNGIVVPGITSDFVTLD